MSNAVQIPNIYYRIIKTIAKNNQISILLVMSVILNDFFSPISKLKYSMEFQQWLETEMKDDFITEPED